MAKKRIPEKIKKTVKNYVERLAQEEKLPISEVIIYGSYAKGIPHRWSDIDVCIVSPKFKNFFNDLEFLLTKRTNEEVIAGLEPIGFSDQDFREGSSLIAEIIKTGIAVRIPALHSS